MATFSRTGMLGGSAGRLMQSVTGGLGGSSPANRDARTILLILANLAIFTSLLFGFYGAFADPAAGAPARFAGTILGAMAPLGLGMVVGFLFGLPKWVQSPGPAPHPGPNPGGAAGTAENPDGHYTPNGNLEMVADWLTKIIVGLGLTQWREILGQLHRASLHLAALVSVSKPDPGAAYAACASAIIYFSCLGVLLGYLWTRLKGAAAMSRGDRDMNLANLLAKAGFDLPPTPLDLADPAPSSPPKDTLALKQLRTAIDVSDLRDARAAETWARAMLAGGNVEKAVQGFRKSLDLEPRNSALRIELGKHLRALGRDQEAAAEFEKASSTAGLREVEELEKFAFSSLYLRPPESFQKVLERLEPKIDAAPYQDSDKLHAYLACAYGQRFKSVQATDPGAAQEDRERALRHVQEAIRINASWKRVLKGLLDKQNADNDLSGFAEDPAFRQVLG